eukprot:tig00000863_g5008.t1
MRPLAERVRSVLLELGLSSGCLAAGALFHGLSPPVLDDWASPAAAVSCTAYAVACRLTRHVQPPLPLAQLATPLSPLRAAASLCILSAAAAEVVYRQTRSQGAGPLEAVQSLALESHLGVLDPKRFDAIYGLPFLEELFFRGLLQWRLGAAGLGAAGAAAASAALYSGAEALSRALRVLQRPAEHPGGAVRAAEELLSRAAAGDVEAGRRQQRALRRMLKDVAVLEERAARRREAALHALGSELWRGIQLSALAAVSGRLWPSVFLHCLTRASAAAVAAAAPSPASDDAQARDPPIQR